MKKVLALSSVLIVILSGCWYSEEGPNPTPTATTTEEPTDEPTYPPITPSPNPTGGQA